MSQERQSETKEKETLLRRILSAKIFKVSDEDNATRASREFHIPYDANLNHFSDPEMEQFFRHCGVNNHVITILKRKRVDGRKFGAMTDERLEALGIKNPIIVYFRDHSKNGRAKFIL